MLICFCVGDMDYKSLIKPNQKNNSKGLFGWFGSHDGSCWQDFCLLPTNIPIPSMYGIFTYIYHMLLGGGFNPFEKYLSNWKSSPNRGEKYKIFETTT